MRVEGILVSRGQLQIELLGVARPAVGQGTASHAVTWIVALSSLIWDDFSVNSMVSSCCLPEIGCLTQSSPPPLGHLFDIWGFLKLFEIQRCSSLQQPAAQFSRFYFSPAKVGNAD